MEQNLKSEDVDKEKRLTSFAIVSLCIGAVLIALNVFRWGKTLPGMFFGQKNYPIPIFFHISIFTNYIGFLSGIIGLKSNKKKMALIGIILCIVAFGMAIPFIWDGWDEYILEWPWYYWPWE